LRIKFIIFGLGKKETLLRNLYNREVGKLEFEHMARSIRKPESRINFWINQEWHDLIVEICKARSSKTSYYYSMSTFIREAIISQAIHQRKKWLKE